MIQPITIGRATIYHADCLVALAQLPENSIDACVTDPPYHLTAGKKGGSGEASVNLDSPYGRSRITTGFMGKQWDGGDVAMRPDTWAAVLHVLKPGAHLLAFGGTRTYHRMVCAIEDAGFEIRDQIGWAFGTGFPKSLNLDGEWTGWGTALKPAWEPICVARKPLIGTVAENVRQHGVGALNIAGCRVPTDSGRPLREARRNEQSDEDRNAYHKGLAGSKAVGDTDLGRWPANIIHDGSDEVIAAFPADAARFFYSAKASKAERHGSKHPTVKPVALMQYLCRLVTPPGGTVLDPFAGTGTTGQAARDEGFNAILIEQEAEYVADIHRRMATTKDLFS